MEKLNKIIQEQLKKHTLSEGSSINPKLEPIAKKYLGIKTLKTQNSDSKDFHELAVWQIKTALNAAYKEGKKSTPKVEQLNEDSFVIDDYLISIQDYITKRLKRLKDGESEELTNKLKEWVNSL